jgi:hypothetical protein
MLLMMIWKSKQKWADCSQTSESVGIQQCDGVVSKKSANGLDQKVYSKYLVTIGLSLS